MVSLVLTHGRDNPHGKEVEMEREFREWVSSGLLSVHAPYARTIPFHYAFYGNLWRKDRRHLWEEPSDSRDAFGDPAEATAVTIADELLTSAGVLDAEEKWFFEGLAQLIAEVQKRLPGFVAEDLLERFAKDTGEYLNHEKLRALAIDRVVSKIKEAREPVILLAHSMGTIVCYDLLRRHPELPVRGFISFGSPLGMEVIMRKVAGSDREAPFPPKLPRWVNVYNQADLVASVRRLAGLYVSGDARKVEDIDTGQMRQPKLTNLFLGHDPGDYLTSLALINALTAMIESEQGGSETAGG